MSKLFEVSFLDSYNTITIVESLVDDYKKFNNVMSIKEITQCQTCGEGTKELELVNGLARCSECQKVSEKMQRRANELMYEPYNLYDNDFY